MRLGVRRSPYGERGLKSRLHEGIVRRDWSLSLRRAWIEIPWCPRRQDSTESLSLRRAWIEIRNGPGQTSLGARRSPYGERGLKCFDAVIDTSGYESLSLRRAWIEIIEVESFQVEKAVALLTESVD